MAGTAAEVLVPEKKASGRIAGGITQAACQAPGSMFMIDRSIGFHRHQFDSPRGCRGFAFHFIIAGLEEHSNLEKKVFPTKPFARSVRGQEAAPHVWPLNRLSSTHGGTPLM